MRLISSGRCRLGWWCGGVNERSKMVAFRRGVCAGGSYTGGWCGSVWLFCDAVLQRIFKYCLPKSYCLGYLIHSG